MTTAAASERIAAQSEADVVDGVKAALAEDVEAPVVEDGVHEVVRISSPYKLASRTFISF